MIIKTKRIKVDTAGLSVRVADGRLQFSLDGFFIRFRSLERRSTRRTSDG